MQHDAGSECSGQWANPQPAAQAAAQASVPRGMLPRRLKIDDICISDGQDPRHHHGTCVLGIIAAFIKIYAQVGMAQKGHGGDARRHCCFIALNFVRTAKQPSREGKHASCANDRKQGRCQGDSALRIASKQKADGCNVGKPWLIVAKVGATKTTANKYRPLRKNSSRLQTGEKVY